MVTVVDAAIVAITCLIVVVAVVVVGVVSTSVMVMVVVDRQLRGLCVLNYGTFDSVQITTGQVILQKFDHPTHDGLGARKVLEESLDDIYFAVSICSFNGEGATQWVLVMFLTSIFVVLGQIVDLFAHIGARTQRSKILTDPEWVFICS